MTDCLVCREVGGAIALPGGAVFDDEHVLGFHVMPTDQNPRPYLGHLLVVTKRHVDHLGDLSDHEARSVAVAARDLARALRSLDDIDRDFSAVIGTGVPHFHLHLLPRRIGTPPDLEWTRVDEWEGAPHGDADEIAEWVTRLRATEAR